MNEQLIDRESFEKVKEACLHDGMKLFAEDLVKHIHASDTIMVRPLIDPDTKTVLSSASDEMLRRQGYVSALNWVAGIIAHYQNNQYEDMLSPEDLEE